MNCEMLSSGHDVAIAIIKPRQLWVPAQNQASRSSGIDKVELQAPLLSKELLAVGSRWGRGIVLFREHG